MWKPKEIIVHEKVMHDPVTDHFLYQCADTPAKYVASGTPKNIIAASDILSNAGNSMLEKILAGKSVVYIAPATDVVDTFTMPDRWYTDQKV